MNSLTVFPSLKIAHPPQAALHLSHGVGEAPVSLTEPPSFCPGSGARTWVRLCPEPRAGLLPLIQSLPPHLPPSPPVSCFLALGCSQQQLPPLLPPCFHSLEQSPSHQTLTLEKSLNFPSKETQTGSYFLVRLGGSPDSIVAKIAGPPPTPLHRLLCSCKHVFLSFLPLSQPSRRSYILLVWPLRQKVSSKS